MKLKNKDRFRKKTIFKFIESKETGDGKLTITIPAIKYKPKYHFVYNYDYDVSFILKTFWRYQNEKKLFKSRYDFQG